LLLLYRAALLGHWVKHGVLKASSASSGAGATPKLNLIRARNKSNSEK
jgi:hypothetical protein